MSETRPGLLDDLPKLATIEIGVLLPGLRQCEAMAGPFDLERLTDQGIPAPAVLVTVLRIAERITRSGPQIEFNAEMAAYVVTKDRMGLPRDAAAAAICQAILPTVPGNRWGDDFVGPAEKVEARSLVTRNTRKAAAALWAVTWTQPFVLQADPRQEIDPIVYLGQAPQIGAGHEEDYEVFGEAST
ncbi:MAG: hypothetical protein QNJ16_19925 [Rhodobacter sp.]|nr:hypothetical protein [Rhodobacter sp.]